MIVNALKPFLEVKKSESSAPLLEQPLSLLLLAIPAVFLLLNGVSVVVLKSFNLPSFFYYCALSLLFILLVVVVPGVVRPYLNNNSTRIYLIATVCASILLACAHLVVYGSSFGTDAAYYYSFAYHTFFIAEHFTFSERPFESFGIQPNNYYWIHANYEFFIISIVKLLNLTIQDAYKLSHLLVNSLFFYSLLVLLGSLMRGSSVVLVSVVAFYLYYMGCSSGNTCTYTAFTIFRGFEAKSLVFGYFSISIFAFLLSRRTKMATENKVFYVCFPALILLAAFFVSGNFLLLFLVFIFLFPASMILNATKIKCLALIVMTLLGVLLVSTISFLQPHDVFDVLNDGGRLPIPPYTEHLSHFVFPDYIAVNILMAFVVLLVNRRLGGFLLVCCLSSILVQSEWFYQLVVLFQPERALLFWRIGILFDFYVFWLIALGVVLHHFQNRKVVQIIIACSAFVALLMVGEPLRGETPYMRKTIPPVVYTLEKSCRPGASVMADSAVSLFMSNVAPQFRYYFGKDYFINWQIANIGEDASALSEARAVLLLGRFLSRESVDINKVVEAIKLIQPEILVSRKRLIPRRYARQLDGYTENQVNGRTVYTKDDVCRF